MRLLELGLGTCGPKSFETLTPGYPHYINAEVAAGARPAQGTVRINEDFFRELFPLKTCSLAATGDVWLELMRNVRWNGDRRRGQPTRGSAALRFHQSGGGAAQALTRAG